MGVPMFIVHDCFEYDGMMAFALVSWPRSGGWWVVCPPQSSPARGSVAELPGREREPEPRDDTEHIGYNITTSGSNDPAVFTITEKDPT